MGKVSSPETDDLRQAYRTKNLVLYLGAGISAANNLPTWEKLVLALYFLTVSEQHLGGWRPFSNYLCAISEWYLENYPEPLEITARKLKKIYEIKNGGDQLFLDRLHRTLYGSLLDDYGMPLDYRDLGIIPVWYKKYADIPNFIAKIMA